MATYKQKTYALHRKKQHLKRTKRKSEFSNKEIEELSKARLIRKGLQPFQLSTHNLDGTAILYKRERGQT
jgi:hypothetical protein